ncbi:GGDEF domain-containing protein [Algicola sagamiensis]|uniref:GGDEF domain-containing protein n=1 Tax=Algicola sagamiensis TaxID=163869 RepID=UPI00037503FB|nr:GGDEF domain-containing protein [Algicola sagamiensis]
MTASGKETIKQIKKQLHDSISARQDIERTHAAQFKLLFQLISKLTLLSKGLDSDLDNKLAAFRKSLSAAKDMDKIEPLVQEINGLLKEQDNKISSSIQSTQKTLKVAGKQLQIRPGLSEKLKRDLKGWIGEVSEVQGPIQSYIPHFDRLVHLYQQALDTSEQQGNGDSESSAIQQISQEVLNLMSELTFEGKQGQQLEKLRKNLLSCNSHSDLIEICLTVLKMIIDHITQERSSAQKFMLSINDALNTVHQAVSTSINTSETINNELHEVNHDIAKQMAQLTREAQEATSLEVLKQHLTEQLIELGGSIQKKNGLEQQEYDELLASLTEMEERLTELEDEASKYRKRMTEQKFKSLQDELTKLPNRAAFEERFSFEYKRWQRYENQLSIAVIDIDFFKRINDTYGHSAGDKTLQAIAKILKQNIRETDFISRYGGEEFVVIFPDLGLRELGQPLEKLRHAVEDKPFMFRDKNVQITISIGATSILSSDSKQGIFDRADAALYESKNKGRNRVTIWSE